MALLRPLVPTVEAPLARVGGPAPLLVGLGCPCRDCGGEDCSLSYVRGLPPLLSAGVFSLSLAGLRRRGMLRLPLVDSRPRLRPRLGGRVDPPQLQLLLVLLSRVYLLPRGQAGLAGGEVVFLSRGELLVSSLRLVLSRGET